MKTTAIVISIISLFFIIDSTCEATFFYNVDYKDNGPMRLESISMNKELFVASDFWILNLSAKNTSSIDLTDVGLVWLFCHDSNNRPISYDNSHHKWNNPQEERMWVRLYGVENQTDLFPMSRDVSNLPLVSEWGASLLTSDEVPVIWLGDISAGQSFEFNVNIETGMDLYYRTGPGLLPYCETYLVSSIPEPGTFFAIGLGGLSLLRKRRI